MHYFRQSTATWVRCLFFLICATGFAKIAPAGAKALLIRGQIVDSQGKPLDGCLISIASASGQQTRSRGVLTEEGGIFEVPFAPNFDGQFSSVPYLEIYWDARLIFRQPLTSLQIKQGSQGSSTLSWTDYLSYGGQIWLSPIKVSH